MGRGARQRTGPPPILTLSTFHKPKSTFPFTHSSPLPASLSTLPPRLSASPPLSPPLLCTSPLHPSCSYFDSGLSLFHPPSSLLQPFSSQPQFPIDLLIAVCLWESGCSLPLSLCSPLHGFVFPFPLLSSPSSPSPSPPSAAALKHELEKAGESNLPGEIRFTFSYTLFPSFSPSIAIFLLRFQGPPLCFAFVSPSCVALMLPHPPGRVLCYTFKPWRGMFCI